MTNITFKKIDNIKEYLESCLNNRIEPKLYQKFQKVNARAGQIGEVVSTVMANGLSETVNTVTADENGNPAFVVTNSTGENYVVDYKIFKRKYEKVDGTEDEYKPVYNPIKAIKIYESISFKAPWGEVQNLATGGYLVFNDTLDDIYGVQEAEFDATYKVI